MTKWMLLGAALWALATFAPAWAQERPDADVLHLQNLKAREATAFASAMRECDYAKSIADGEDADTYGRHCRVAKRHFETVKAERDAAEARLEAKRQWLAR